MIPDTLGQKLHDKATRGEMLSKEEQTQLVEWYTHQDKNEADELIIPESNVNISTIQVQIEEVLAQLSTLTNHIQQIINENKVLRQDNNDLHQQLIDQHQPV